MNESSSPAKSSSAARQAAKHEARAQWSHDPAGALAVGDEPLGSPDSFVRIEKHRYAEQPWMHETFIFERWAGKRVLEVGVGLGTDHIQFARSGAQMAGVDLVPRCVEMTARRLEQEGLRSQLAVMDAEAPELCRYQETRWCTLL